VDELLGICAELGLDVEPKKPGLIEPGDSDSEKPPRRNMEI
jgi:hypothetical protein